jgi:hypothetical protein
MPSVAELISMKPQVMIPNHLLVPLPLVPLPQVPPLVHFRPLYLEPLLMLPH